MLRKALVAAMLATCLSTAAAMPAHAQTAHDVSVRDQLIANQENLLNAYRCMFGVDIHAVKGGCDSPVQIVPGQAPENPIQSDIDIRDLLIQNQEVLLNVYRCRFDIDTELVADGCGDDSESDKPDGGELLAVGTCPGQYPDAGSEFLYDPSAETADEAAERQCSGFCGEWCGYGRAETITCPYGTDLSGQTIQYIDVGTLDDEDLVEIHCTRQSQPIPSVWRVFHNEDGELVGAFSLSSRHSYGEALPPPRFIIGCENRTLTVAVTVPDGNGLPRFDGTVPVGYGFAKSTAQPDTSATWVQQRWTGRPLTGGVVVMPGEIADNDEQMAAFLNNLRSHGYLVFRVAEEDNSLSTMQFPLAGVSQSVDPILNACGY